LVVGIKSGCGDHLRIALREEYGLREHLLLVGDWEGLPVEVVIIEVRLLLGVLSEE